MKEFALLFFLSTILLFTFSSCEEVQEPSEINEVTLGLPMPSEISKVTVAERDGFILKYDGSNLMYVEIRDGSFIVSSVFSNVTLRPTITYLGQYSSFDQVPVKNVGTGSMSWTIRNGGGFNIMTEVYDPSIRADRKFIVKLYMTVTSDNSITMTYQVFPQGGGKCFLSCNGNNLLLLEIDDDNNFKVSSYLSNVSVKPTITYLGQYNSFEDVPLENVGIGSTSYEIKDKGGYNLFLKIYNPETQKDVTYIVRLFMTYIKDSQGNNKSVSITYQYLSL